MTPSREGGVSTLDPSALRRRARRVVRLLRTRSAAAYTASAPRQPQCRVESVGLAGEEFIFIILNDLTDRKRPK